MDYLALGKHTCEVPSQELENREKETEMFEITGDQQGFLRVLKENKQKMQTYAADKEKTLLQDIFSTPTGVKMLKADVEHAAGLLKDHSIRHTGGSISFQLTNESIYGAIKRLEEIKNARFADKQLANNSYFSTAWSKFLLKQLTIFITAIAQKTGLILRDAYDLAKYEDGSFLKFSGGHYTVHFWW